MKRLIIKKRKKRVFESLFFLSIVNVFFIVNHGSNYSDVQLSIQIALNLIALFFILKDGIDNSNQIEITEETIKIKETEIPTHKIKHIKLYVSEWSDNNEQTFLIAHTSGQESIILDNLEIDEEAFFKALNTIAKNHEFEVIDEL